jgi:hypothetical protein
LVPITAVAVRRGLTGSSDGDVEAARVCPGGAAIELPLRRNAPASSRAHPRMWVLRRVV